MVERRGRESSYYLWKSRANLTSGATGVFPVNIYEPSVPPLSRHGSSPPFQHHAQFSILETPKFPRETILPTFLPFLLENSNFDEKGEEMPRWLTVRLLDLLENIKRALRV